MNTLTATTASTSAIRPATRFGRQLWAAFHQRLMRHRTVTTIRALDDHILKDIGLSRDQISAEFFRAAAEAQRSPQW